MNDQPISSPSPDSGLTPAPTDPAPTISAQTAPQGGTETTAPPASASQPTSQPTSTAQPAVPKNTEFNASSNASSNAAFAGLLAQPMRLLTAAVILLFFLLFALWWDASAELRSLRSEVAGRLQSGDVVNNETKLLAKVTQEIQRDLQTKIGVLESRQIEQQSQQVALEQMYQDLSKNRDDWALAEIELVLSTASQQLQLAGNVQGALIALQNADARLSRSDKPQFITIRRAIARDQEKLKALPLVDLTGLALRLDSIIGQIDAMPLLADEKPIVPATPPKTSRRAERAAARAAAGEKPSASAEWLGALEDKWQSLINEMWVEVRQLVRIRDVEEPDALLLSPQQMYFVRENVKLRLLNGRLALLARNESAFRSDLNGAQDTITKYFDTRAKHTQSTLAILRQVQGSNLSIEMPTLADSLNAVRGYKAKP